MLITALEKADEPTRIQLQEWLDAEDYEPARKIEAVTDIYNKVGVRAICRDKINEYYQEGVALLDKVGIDASYKKNLADFVLRLMNRNL